MKRFLLLTICSLSFNVLFSQVQPMAVLPAAMQIAGAAKSTSEPAAVCLSLFSETPQAYDILRPIGSSQGSSYVIGTGEHGSVRLGESISALSPDTRFFSTDGHPIDERLRLFATNKIAEFNRPGFDKDKLLELQSHIWSYNVLDRLGLFSNATDRVLAFDDVVKEFCFQYDISTTSASKYDDIVLIGTAVAENRSIPFYGDVSVVGNHIKASVDPAYEGAADIPIHFTDYMVDENIIRLNASDIQQDISDFMKNIQDLPAEIEIIHDYRQQRHILKIHGQYGDIMQFSLPYRHTQIINPALLQISKACA